MATAALIPVSEYLASTYRPDCDYIDGELQERNVGERPHAALQGVLYTIFMANRRAWDILAFTELRVQTGPNRFRVPDVSVLRRTDPPDSIVQVPPLVCIEIFSPEDRITRMQERINDYIQMGVKHIWLFDPASRHAWVATPDGSHTRILEELKVPGTPVCISLADVFTELDDIQTPA